MAEARDKRHQTLSFVCIAILLSKVNGQDPVFKTDPSDSWVNKDNPSSRPLSLICSAQGSRPLTIRMYKDNKRINKPDAEITGGDASGNLRLSYYINQPTVHDAGKYFCEAENVFKTTIRSRTAVVSLYETPRFLSQPKNASGDLLTNVTFNCTSSGVPHPAYQWFFNGSAVPVPGATSATYTVNLSNPAVAGTYQCKVGNPVSTLSSMVAYLKVISVEPYLITALDTAKQINYGDQTYQLFCNGSGIPPVSYRWKKNGLVVPNANSHTLIPDKKTPAKYTCEVFNILGVADSSIDITIITTLPLIRIPYSTNAVRTYEGYPLELRCTAGGVPQPSLSWEFKDFRSRMFQLPSTNGVFYKQSTTEYDAGLYFCIATNFVGTTRSAGIFVVIDYRTPPPSFTVSSAPPTLPPHLSFTAAQSLTSPPTTTPAVTTTAYPVTDSSTSHETNATDTTSAAPFETTTITTVNTSEPDNSSAQTTQPPTSRAATLTTTPATSASPSGAATTAPDGGSEGSSVDTGAVVGGVLGGVLGLLLLSALLVILYVRYRSSSQSKDPDKRPLQQSRSPMSVSSIPEDVQLDMDVMAAANPELSLDFSKLKTTSVSSDGPTRLDIISMRELIERVDGAINAGLRSNVLSDEYNATPLNMIGIEQMIAGTEHKNRYMNVLPNMNTAVKLAPLSEGDIVSTYINANHMPSFDGESQPYIAAQGPTAETIDDFWRMIWEQDISVVVMATQLVERGRAKCARYWPSDGIMEQQYGDFNVVVNDITNFESYILTEMSIFKAEDDGTVDLKGEAKTVRHFWFQAWPDFGIPQSTEPILTFLKVIWDARKNADSPVLLHCSAGIGRTGTLMSVHMGMQEFDVSGRVDPHTYMKMLRASRGGCIQTFDQYLFIHRALYTYMQQSTKDNPGPL